MTLRFPVAAILALFVSVTGAQAAQIDIFAFSSISGEDIDNANENDSGSFVTASKKEADAESFAVGRALAYASADTDSGLLQVSAEVTNPNGDLDPELTYFAQGSAEITENLTISVEDEGTGSISFLFYADAILFNGGQSGVNTALYGASLTIGIGSQLLYDDSFVLDETGFGLLTADLDDVSHGDVLTVTHKITAGIIRVGSDTESIVDGLSTGILNIETGAGVSFTSDTPTYLSTAPSIVLPEDPVSSVPLPAGLPMLLGGLAVLGFAKRRRK